MSVCVLPRVRNSLIEDKAAAESGAACTCTCRHTYIHTYIHTYLAHCAPSLLISSVCDKCDI